MNFNGEYRQIGVCELTALRAAVEAFDEATWQAEARRQQVFMVHVQTETIPLIFDPDMRHTNPSIRPLYHELEPLLKPVTDLIRAAYGQNPPKGLSAEQARSGYFVRIIAVRLAAQGKIGSHRDNGYSLSRAHRIHLPLVTHPQAVFGIAGVIKHLAAGEIWEINNRQAHAVRNAADKARIHLIFDYVIPGEVVADIDGEQLVA